MNGRDMILLAVHLYAVLAVQTQKGPVHPPSRAEVASVRRFARTFYDWYAPKSNADSPSDAEHLALSTRPAAFSPELRNALLEDWTAQSKVTGEIVGIDWDPFLGGQDPASRYWVRKIQHNGQTWLVSVWSSYGKQSHAPDVIAQVEKSGGKNGWCFTDFFYPHAPGSGLLDSLRLLKKEREQPTTGEPEGTSRGRK